MLKGCDCSVEEPVEVVWPVLLMRILPVWAVAGRAVPSATKTNSAAAKRRNQPPDPRAAGEDLGGQAGQDLNPGSRLPALLFYRQQRLSC